MGALIAVMFATQTVGGILINSGTQITHKDVSPVFLPTQHNRILFQPQTHSNVLKEAKVNHKKIFYQRYGRCGYVNRPLNTSSNQKIAFRSILNFSPNTNTKYKYNNKQNNEIINNLLSHASSSNTSNATSFNKCYEANITANNKQYSIFMNHEYNNILSFIITQNINIPLYIRNGFHCALNPTQINVCAGAIQIMTEENAGGCSELSEGFSFEILKQCFNAKLLKTEMAIKYWWTHWKKTDYSIQLNKINIGVSVTRAMKYNGLFNKKDALKLLTKKLNGINESTEGVLECDQWQRQILHIWCTDKYIEIILHKTFLNLLFTNPELVNNTIILVTVASEDMWWIFYQDKYFKKKQVNKKKKKKKKKVVKKNSLISAVT